MKIISPKEDLTKGLAIVNRAAGKSYLPILNNVLLATVDDNCLQLSATDLEIRIDHRQPARVEEPGTTTVPARLFTDFVNSLSNGVDVCLALNGSKIGVTCDPHSANIHCIPADEFPTLPAFGDDASEVIPATVLRPMLKQALIAASADYSRPTLTGVLIKLDGQELILSAADGFRLSVCRAHLETEAAEPISAVIPRRALAGLERLLKADDDTSVEVYLLECQVLFRLPDTDLAAQLIDDRFPNYEQIIPKRHDTRTTVSTTEFLRACRTASIFARDEANIVRLSVSEGRMVIAASSSEIGNNVTEIDAEMDGEQIEIAFNVKFLVDVLSVIDTDQVVIETTAASDPAVIRPAGTDSFIHVVMPMHIRDE
jgi:DNA polymerase-3 subunit beta